MGGGQGPDFSPVLLLKTHKNKLSNYVQIDIFRIFSSSLPEKNLIVAHQSATYGLLMNWKKILVV